MKTLDLENLVAQLRDSSGRVGWYDSVGQWTYGGGILEDAALAIERLMLDNKDQQYEIEKLIYRRDHPGEL